MATLLPAFGACVSRMTPGERRLAERLEHKLDEDYLLWYDVPIGPRHPKQVKRTLEELAAKGGVRFEGDKPGRQYWVVPR